MKARNKVEREVEALSAQLNPLSQSDIAFMKRSVNHVALYSVRKVRCTECGHEWKQAGLNKQVRCPHCGMLLKVEKTRKRKTSESYFIIISQAFQGWQVNRYFLVKWWCKKQGGRKYWIAEAVQQWMNGNGNYHVMARNRNAMSYYYDTFNYETPLTIKRNKDYASYHLPYWAVKVKSTIPTLKRNGFRTTLCNMSPFRLFKALLTTPFAETLYKAGHYGLLKAMSEKYFLDDAKYVAAAKIVLRNDYRLSYDDACLWVDMVQNLITLEKDIRNSHYVCPPDLKKSHDLAVKKVHQQRQREMERERLERIRKDEYLASSYVQRMGKFFDLVFRKGNLVIGVLKSVAEFEEEGNAMHHCVFANKYFAKEHSLVMSAKIDGKRKETVEVDLKNFRIIQSRGVNNEMTTYHNEIVDLVNENMGKIRKVCV